MEDTLLTPKQAAERLGVSHITLARWRVQGRGLPFIRLGGRIRYSIADIEAWIASQRVHGAPA